MWIRISLSWGLHDERGVGVCGLPHIQIPPYRQPQPTPCAAGWSWGNCQRLITIHHALELSVWNGCGRHQDVVSQEDQGHCMMPVAPEEKVELMESAVSSHVFIRATLYNLFSVFLSSNLQAFKRYFGWLICLDHKNNSPSCAKGLCVEPEPHLPLEAPTLT